MVRDLVYAQAGDRKVQLDLYLPKKPICERVPCIVTIHGGGWRSGDKSRFAAKAAPADMHRYSQRSGASEELARLISPITHVDADSAPILLIHSKTDPTVPYQMSVDLAAKYGGAGVESELILIEKAPHAFWNFDQWFSDTMQRSRKFFEKHLVVERQ